MEQHTKRCNQLREGGSWGDHLKNVTINRNSKFTLRHYKQKQEGIFQLQKTQLDKPHGPVIHPLATLAETKSNWPIFKNDKQKIHPMTFQAWLKAPQLPPHTRAQQSAQWIRFTAPQWQQHRQWSRVQYESDSTSCVTSFFCARLHSRHVYVLPCYMFYAAFHK